MTNTRGRQPQQELPSFSVGCPGPCSPHLSRTALPQQSAELPLSLLSSHTSQSLIPGQGVCNIPVSKWRENACLGSLQQILRISRMIDHLISIGLASVGRVGSRSGAGKEGTTPDNRQGDRHQNPLPLGAARRSMRISVGRHRFGWGPSPTIPGRVWRSPASEIVFRSTENLRSPVTES
jgi:hypothetical protein